MARIEHFALFTDDLETLREFYETTFGLKVIVDNSKAPVKGYFLADEAGAVIELIQRPEGVPAVDTRYACHVAFHVDDYDDARAALALGGAVFETDTRIGTGVFRTEFFNDPAGNRCQIVWRRTPLGAS